MASSPDINEPSTRQATGHPTVLHCNHPELAAIDEQVMAADRRWFAKHPDHLVRLRPAIDGEFLVDTVAGLYGQRPSIALADASPGSPPHVAVVSIESVLGVPRNADGTGGRLRFPVGHHPRSRRRDIEARAVAMARASLGFIRNQPPEALITFPTEAR
jgi:hypothetical protein